MSDKKCTSPADFLENLPIAREGYIIIIIFFVGAILLGAIDSFFGVIGGMLFAWSIWFFRDPDRVTPEAESAIPAPCDGKVIAIREREMPLSDGEKTTCVSIFMNVFDVHVVRTPFEGKIEEEFYHRGRFLNAALDKASEENERQTYLVKTPHGKGAFTLVAGLVARRIVPRVAVGEKLKKGQRVGVIRFGSRVDVFLPKGVKPSIEIGQSTISGETVIAEATKAAADKSKAKAK